MIEGRGGACVIRHRSKKKSVGGGKKKVYFATAAFGTMIA